MRLTPRCAATQGKIETEISISGKLCLFWSIRYYFHQESLMAS